MRSVVQRTAEVQTAGVRHEFTLLELIAVLALLGALLGAAAPSLRNMLYGRSIGNEARRLLALTHYALAESASQSSALLLWIDPENRMYGVAHGDDGQEDLLVYHTASDVSLEVDREFCDSQGRCVIPVIPDGEFSSDEQPEVRLFQTVTGESLWLRYDRTRCAFVVETEEE